ncbi:hypothetical protein CBL_01937 [Carabus blaptoides fortunei]
MAMGLARCAGLMYLPILPGTAASKCNLVRPALTNCQPALMGSLHLYCVFIEKISSVKECIAEEQFNYLFVHIRARPELLVQRMKLMELEMCDCLRMVNVWK